MLPISLLPWSTNQTLPSGATVMADGWEVPAIWVGVMRLLLLGSMLPTMPVVWSVNQLFPLGDLAMPASPVPPCAVPDTNVSERTVPVVFITPIVPPLEGPVLV